MCRSEATGEQRASPSVLPHGPEEPNRNRPGQWPPQLFEGDEVDEQILSFKDSWRVVMRYRRVAAVLRRARP